MKAFSLCVAALTVSASCLLAGEPIKEGVSPEAHQVLKEVGEFYGRLPFANADIQLSMVQELQGQPKRESQMKAAFAVGRPRLFLLKLEADRGGITIACDGHNLWTYVPALKQFTVDSAPMTLDILLRYHDPAPRALSQLGPLCELFRKDPAALMLGNVNSLKVAGTETLAGAECVRLHGEQDDMDWDAWFQKGDQPLLRKFTFSPIKGMLAQAPEEYREKLRTAKLDVTVDYTWKIGTEAPPNLFAFEPPAEVQKVAHFFVPEKEQAPVGEGSALVGKPAPDFTLGTLDGGKMHLADLKGKIVVLDFWATWCGPCVHALPIISEVTKARKDQGVVLLAVNVQEEADQIKAFLSAKKLDVSVVLDEEGVAAKLYNVSGIPQTVIIDQDGNVADLHVGFSPGLKDQLSKKLDALLAKKAEPAPAPAPAAAQP